MANQISVNTGTGNQQVTVTSTGNIQVTTSRSVIGTVANVASANYANFAGNVTGANQPNITTVGTLSNLTVANTITTNNLVVTGNFSVGNLVANNANYANFANVANTANSVVGSNVSGQVGYAAVANSVALANVSGAGNIASLNLDGNSGNILFGNGIFAAAPSVSNVANANYSNFAGTAFSVSGSNVSGIVANANYSAYANIAATANSVAVANVSGIGNIAVINLDGNASNILYGNGVFGPDVGPQDVANANYANFAGTAYSVSGSNVSGAVNLANYATVANSVAGANVSGDVSGANHANIADSANSVAVANVSGIGNIATINLDGNVSNTLLGNGSWGPVEVQSTSIANGTSNVSIPVANGAVAFGVNNVANLVMIDNGGIINTFPTSSIVNTMRINTFGSAVGDAHRIAWARARGSNTSPTSVNPNDNLGTLSFFGHNGNSYQTSSVGFVRARVDANYTANGANIPIGLQLIVNDTNGGTNNQTKIHNFYSNGNTSLSGALTIDGGSLLVSTNGGASPANVTVNGDGTTNSSMYLANVGFGVNWSNVDTSSGYSPFRFDQITSLTNEVGVIRNFRARGTSFSNISAVTANDYVYQQDYGVYGDSGNTYLSVGGSSVVVTGNDGAGNVPANLTISAGSGLGQASSNIIFNAGNTQFNSNVTATNATLGNLATANFFSGDGSLLSNITAGNITGLSYISNGTSNVSIPTADGNILFSTAGNANVVTIDTSGVLNATQANLTNGFGDQLIIRGLDNANSSAPPHIVFRASSGNISNPEPLTAQYGSQYYILNAQGWNGSDWAFAGSQSMRYAGEPASPSWFTYGEPVYNYIQPINSGPGAGNTGYFFENRNGGSLYVGAFDIDDGFNATPFDYSFNIALDGSGSNFQTFQMTYGGNLNIAESYNGNSANITGNITSGNINGGNLVSANYFSGDGGLLSNIAVANISGIGNIATVNLDGNVSNILHGDGSWGPESETGNANYAAYAGNVTIATQSNITSLGNLINLTVSNGVSNTRSPTLQVTPELVTWGNAPAGATFMSVVDYGSQGGNGVASNFTFVKARGNSAVPTAAANNDQTMRIMGHVYNGNTYPRSTVISTFAPQAANANLQYANTVWTAGQFNMVTGNPFGNVYSNTSNTAQNVLFMGPTGQLAMIAGTYGANNHIAMYNSGGNSDGSGRGGEFSVFRQRGNRDSYLAVQNTDQIGGLTLSATSGTGVATFRDAGNLIFTVNTAYGAVTSGNTIPVDAKLTVTNNSNVYYSTTFQGDGNVSFPGTISASNVSINTSGFMKLASYTASALAAITGQIGWMAAVSDSAGGSSPNGMIAFWDTTNSRWSYVHDNTAV